MSPFGLLATTDANPGRGGGVRVTILAGKYAARALHEGAADASAHGDGACGDSLDSPWRGRLVRSMAPVC
jgi:flavin-dependent dehydrogenase